MLSNKYYINATLAFFSTNGYEIYGFLKFLFFLFILLKEKCYNFITSIATLIFCMGYKTVYVVFCDKVYCFWSKIMRY